MGYFCVAGDVTINTLFTDYILYRYFYCLNQHIACYFSLIYEYFWAYLYNIVAYAAMNPIQYIMDTRTFRKTVGGVGANFSCVPIWFLFSHFAVVSKLPQTEKRSIFSRNEEMNEFNAWISHHPPASLPHLARMYLYVDSAFKASVMCTSIGVLLLDYFTSWLCLVILLSRRDTGTRPPMHPAYSWM